MANPRTAVHRALEVSEIYQVVVEHCAKRDLAVLARTARFLHDVAVDALWHTMTSFRPLVKTLPSGAYTEVDGTIAKIRLSHGRPVDTSRLDRYRSRVVCLQINAADVHPADLAVLFSLAKPFLPRLQQYCLKDPACYDLLFCFLTPTLHTINVRMPPQAVGKAVCVVDYEVRDLLHAVLGRCPNVKRLEMSCDWDPTHLFELSCGTYEAFVLQAAPRLSRCLVQVPLTTNAARALLDARLKQTYLNLRRVDMGKLIEAMATIETRPWAGMNKFYLDFMSFDKLTGCFVSNLDMPELRYLYVKSAHTSSRAAVHLQMDALSKLGCEDSLTYLGLHLSSLRPDCTWRPPGDDDDNRLVGAEVIRPAFVFKHLTRLQIVSSDMRADNGLVAEVAAAFPLLETLCLRAPPELPPTSPRATMKALVILAERCVHLRKLWLCVDSTKDLLDVGRAVADKKCLRRLTHWYLDTSVPPDSGIPAEMQLARHLRALCPAMSSMTFRDLTGLDGRLRAPLEMYEGWDQMWVAYWQRWLRIEKFRVLLFGLSVRHERVEDAGVVRGISLLQV